ncbi:MAG: tetratricopeptide repeat protein [Nitrospirae bacterium]|nr:tetratricopeptide repeat protein [Nitrospirota bacterium]
MTHKLLALSIIALFLFSCRGMQIEKKPEELLLPEKEKLSPEVQQEKSMEVFEEILELTLEEDRQAQVPKMEIAYKRIISEYPDSVLAGESYLRLIMINLNDYAPPKIQEAEEIYQEFLRKYPNSSLRLTIEDTIARFYYKNYLWQKLFEFCTPQVREFVKSGRLNSPFFLFLFSEANFNLGDLIEAEKGFKIIRELFPSSTEAIIANDRLKEIKIKKR